MTERILRCIAAHWQRYGYGPSYAHVGRSVNKSQSWAWWQVIQLEAEGLVAIGRGHNSIRLTDAGRKVVTL
jgi:hypothetical protein